MSPGFPVWGCCLRVTFVGQGGMMTLYVDSRDDLAAVHDRGFHCLFFLGPVGMSHSEMDCLITSTSSVFEIRRRAWRYRPLPPEAWASLFTFSPHQEGTP